MENNDKVELTLLQKTANNLWKFRMKYHPTFGAIFEALRKAEIFDAKTVHEFGTVFCLINDEGIWLLSHCFSNWSEMYEKINKKKTEQGESRKYYDCGFVCDFCNEVFGIFESRYSCEACQDIYCSRCKAHHDAKHQQQEQKGQFKQTWDGDEADLEWLKRMFSEATGQYFSQAHTDGTYTHTWTFTNGFFGFDPGQQSSQEQPQQTAAPLTAKEAFALLGLPVVATEQEIRRAFRRKAKEAHPDTGGSEQTFKALNAAYQLALAHAKTNT